MNRLLICPKGSRREGWKEVKPVIIDCQIDKMYINWGRKTLVVACRRVGAVFSIVGGLGVFILLVI